jgi:hypothetical protein
MDSRMSDKSLNVAILEYDDLQYYPDDWQIDTVMYPAFRRSHRFILRNLKAERIYIKQSSDSTIWIEVSGCIKKNLPNVYKTSDGFVHIEGNLVPSGQHAHTLGIQDLSIKKPAPTLRTFSPPIVQVNQIVVYVPEASEAMMLWLEAESIRATVTLRDVFIYCLRSPEVMQFRYIVDPTITLDDNSHLRVDEVNGSVSLTLYSEAIVVDERRPYTQVELMNGTIGVCNVLIPEVGFAEIPVYSVSHLRGLIGDGAALRIKKPNTDVLCKLSGSRFRTL